MIHHQPSFPNKIVTGNLVIPGKIQETYTLLPVTACCQKYPDDSDFPSVKATELVLMTSELTLDIICLWGAAGSWIRAVWGSDVWVVADCICRSWCSCRPLYRTDDISHDKGTLLPEGDGSLCYSLYVRPPAKAALEGVPVRADSQQWQDPQNWGQPQWWQCWWRAWGWWLILTLCLLVWEEGSF